MTTKSYKKTINFAATKLALRFAEIVLGQKEDIMDMIEKMFLLLATPNTPSDGMSLNAGHMSILRGFRRVDP